MRWEGVSLTVIIWLKTGADMKRAYEFDSENNTVLDPSVPSIHSRPSAAQIKIYLGAVYEAFQNREIRGCVPTPGDYRNRPLGTGDVIQLGEWAWVIEANGRFTETPWPKP
jgi:hypothetical protein